MELEDKPFWRDMPLLPESLEWVQKAFWDLSGSRRSSGYGSGRIPFEAADRYAIRLGIEDFDAFWAMLETMDETYLTWQNEEMKRNRSK